MPGNMTVGRMIKLLSGHDPEAPMLVLFDGRAGVASLLYVVHGLSDPPDWADERTVYIDTDGG